MKPLTRNIVDYDPKAEVWCKLTTAVDVEPEYDLQNLALLVCNILKIPYWDENFS